jgi:hypothetical protein
MRRRWASLRRSLIAGGVLALVITLGTAVVGQFGPTLLTGRDENPQWSAIGSVSPVTWAGFCKRGEVLMKGPPNRFFWWYNEVSGPEDYPMIAVGPEGVGVAVPEIKGLEMVSLGVIPYWATFLIMWVVCAGGWLVTSSLHRRVRGGLRAARHRRHVVRGRCGSCGYDMTGNVSGRCPECGGRWHRRHRICAEALQRSVAT